MNDSKVFDMLESDISRQVLTVVGTGPNPPPGPDPDPDVKPDPDPVPVKSFRVIFVKESGQTLNAAQTAIPAAKAIRAYLNLKTTQEGNVPGWREYDPQQIVASRPREPESIRPCLFRWQ